MLYFGEDEIAFMNLGVDNMNRRLQVHLSFMVKHNIASAPNLLKGEGHVEGNPPLILGLTEC